MAKNKNKTKKAMSHEMVQMANAKVSELLSKQNFKSIEEANEFLSKNINGKRIDDIFFNKKGIKTNVEKSEDLIYEAYESTPAKGLKLAKEALKLDPENIRAINYLADIENRPEEAIKLYKQSMEMGEKKLGKKYFQENKGDFWGLHETRPYMTAKNKYADCLKVIGKIEEAIKEYKELLELNPNDNQGIRYILSGILLRNKKYDDYFRLYKAYDDERSTFWLFNYALYLFITKGATADSFKALQDANKSNKHIIQFMTRQKEMPKKLPEYYSPGDENEAFCYILDNVYTWIEHPKTADWINDFKEKQNRLN
ncbi:MAG: hypothetical protein COZ21_07620 [Bacteroidetes bacterium CG_4_10_14_3_um_filter_31_20]|nr:hypothetical protein [Bacteroidota bacterium]PIY04051.1 MAG: hypothetical protein COZ21_07620 [Bacteroidetes bacterium CG_4_10_14_3_um_filter_31_20]